MHVLTGFCIMSLLRRKRRQNRLRQQLSPATRETRLSLEPSFPEVRGLRTNYVLNRNLRVSPKQERKRLRTLIELPHNPARIDFNRDVRQLMAIHQYNKIRQKQSKFAVKPLQTIQLDKTIRVDLPPEHPICIERERRREVMFAKDKAGSSGQKPRREDNNIKLRCK